MTRIRILGAALTAAALCLVSQPAQAWYAGDGFNLNDPQAILPTYTIRLIDSIGIETVRPEVERAADEYETITGLTATVASGTISARAANSGEILVRTAADAPSCPIDWAGCTYSTTGTGGPRTGVTYQLSAQVYINVTILALPTTLRHVVMHEMGHAWGLQHYNVSFEGQIQIMHGTNHAASSYQSGDANGFLYERDYGA